MKTKTKALILSLCAVLLVAASVLGTMAYLTSEDSVTNTFTVGNVAITLDETDVDNNPEAVSGRDQENSYHLLPGHEYTKDPIIHVDPYSEDCYLFVKVVNEITAIEAATTVADQMAANGWIEVDGADGIYVYVSTEGATDPVAVAAGSNITVFETFTIDGSVDNNGLVDYASKTITVTAYAVQKDGFEEATAAVIWNTVFSEAH